MQYDQSKSLLIRITTSSSYIAVINPSHIDLQSLRIFVTVAEVGSLTKASEKLHVTLSALSKRVAELEREMDCPLFLRLPRGLELTPAGRELVQHARAILEAVNRMAGDMSDFAIGVRGHVHVWANTSAIVQFLPQDLGFFLRNQQQIRISLEERLSHEVVQAVVAGDADIGIFADNVPSNGLAKFRYRSDVLVVLVPADHALASLSEIAFSETLDFDFVGLNQGSSLLRRISDEAAALQRVLRLRIQVSSFDAICRMIEAGLGIGVLPEAAVRTELLGASLRAIRLTDAWANRTLWLGVKSEEALLPEASKLLQHLRGAGS